MLSPSYDCGARIQNYQHITKEFPTIQFEDTIQNICELANIVLNWLGKFYLDFQFISNYDLK